ncbi:hypothetical protein WDU94_000625 [Cyamophila willieti]
MQEKGIFTHQSESDADLLIVKTAIDKSAFNPVALVGEDVDLAVLLMACTPSTRDVFMINLAEERRRWLHSRHKKCNNLPPQDWGWTMEGDVLVPTQTEDPPAPEVVLKTIFCRCTKDCSSGKCSCRKAMLVCNTACSHCQGSCLNGVPLFEEHENEDDISPPASPLASPISSQLTFWDEDEDIAGPSNPKRPRVT